QRDQLRSGLDRVARLEGALAGSNLKLVRRAQDAVARLWPQLQSLGTTELSDTVEKLEEALASAEFSEHLKSIGQRGDEIHQAYDAARTELACKTEDAVQRQIDDLRNRQIWEAVAEESRTTLLRPFEQLRMKAQGATASLPALQSGLYALDGMHAEAVRRLVE